MAVGMGMLLLIIGSFRAAIPWQEGHGKEDMIRN